MPAFNQREAEKRIMINVIDALIGDNRALFVNNAVFHKGLKELAKFTMEHRKLLYKTALSYDEEYQRRFKDALKDIPVDSDPQR